MPSPTPSLPDRLREVWYTALDWAGTALVGAVLAVVVGVVLLQYAVAIIALASMGWTTFVSVIAIAVFIGWFTFGV